jgi:hypothetical protein
LRSHGRRLAASCRARIQRRARTDHPGARLKACEEITTFNAEIAEHAENS